MSFQTTIAQRLGESICFIITIAHIVMSMVAALDGTLVALDLVTNTSLSGT